MYSTFAKPTLLPLLLTYSERDAHSPLDNH